MIKFGMKSTFLNFQDQCYECADSDDPDNKPLSIGAYESAWLADLVIAYTLDRTRDCLNPGDTLEFYRDDGWGVFQSKMSCQDMTTWMLHFQEKVNMLAEGTYLQFTCTMWIPGSKEQANNPSTEIMSKNAFPYLDLEMFWTSNNLRFKVHKKPNQQLHHLNTDSLHTKACKKAIPEGVHYRLGKLTTLDETDGSKPVSEIYPEHYQKLEKAGLVKGDPPTMNQINEWATQKASQEHKQAKSREQRERDRSLFFVINHSQAWTKPIHKVINASRKEIGRAHV